jgi:hypothetical protein
MIALLVVAVGLRFTFIEAHAFLLNESQEIFAINAAQNELRDEIGNTSYNVIAQDHGSIISTADGDKRVVRVVFTQRNITLTALVDMDTGNVVEKTRIESSGWMAGYQNQNPKRWGRLHLFNR